MLTALQEVEDNLVAAVNLAQEEQVQTEALAAAQKSLTVPNNQYQAGIVASSERALGPDDGAFGAQNSLNSVRNRRLTAVNTLLKNVAGRWEPLDAGQRKE